MPMKVVKKPERGHFLHPELHGQPEEKSIEWAHHPEQMRQMKEERERWQREQNNQAAAPAARPNHR